MSKLLHWMALLPLLADPVVATQAMYAMPKEPDAFCYRKTVTEQIENLNSMCKQGLQIEPAKAVSVTALTNQALTQMSSRSRQSNQPSGKQRTRSTTTAAPKPAIAARKPVIVKPNVSDKLEFSNLKFEGNYLTGSVRNKTGQKLSGVLIRYDRQQRKSVSHWVSLGGGLITVPRSQLSVGQTVEFQEYISPAVNKVVITAADAY